MTSDELIASRMPLTPATQTWLESAPCKRISSSITGAATRAQDVAKPSQRIRGFHGDLAYDACSADTEVPMQAPCTLSRLDSDILLGLGQRKATASSCMFDSLVLPPLGGPCIENELAWLDFGYLMENMIYAVGEPFTGLRVTSWVALSGNPGSHVRLREVAEFGAGLAFFPWANHRRLQHPGRTDVVMDFKNNTVAGGPYSITLEPTDALVWCPAKYIWPACVVCGKFLFPCEPHRLSRGHCPAAQVWWRSLTSLQSLHDTRHKYAHSFLQKNLFGLANSS
jgi:hypothetical protein